MGNLIESNELSKYKIILMDARVSSEFITFTFIDEVDILSTVIEAKLTYYYILRGSDGETRNVCGFMNGKTLNELHQ